MLLPSYQDAYQAHNVTYLNVVGHFQKRTSFKEYTVDSVDEPTFNVGSADHSFKYDKVYFEHTEIQPTSKHGIKITSDGQIFSSAIICETEEQLEYSATPL